MRHTSLKCVTAAPCDRRIYMELVEYPPDGSRAHATSSSSLEKVHRSNTLHRFSHGFHQAKGLSKSNAPTVQVSHPRDHGERVVAIVEEPREVIAERPQPRPPIKPEVGAPTIAYPMPSSQFEVPFNLWNGIPEL
jgi:hypothetical protein